MRKVILLGASGNIGGQSLDVLASEKDAFELVGFSVGHKIGGIDSALASFPSVRSICVQEEKDAEALRPTHPGLSILHGDEGLKELIEGTEADIVINALVGFAGLIPSLTALRQGRILCLANKETLVVGGEFVARLLAAGHGKLYPIDSEHVALAKCLSQVRREDVEELILTASGGAFRDLGREGLAQVTPEMALRHPTWSMGPKITIDSDTMMNKGFEVIEAHYLFSWPAERIGILIQPESRVHSLLKMKDGTYWAEVSEPDMHGPIRYALHEGRDRSSLRHERRLEDFGPYAFRPFDPQRYPAVPMCLSALAEGGVKPAILNAADEEAVGLFLKGKAAFTDIEKICAAALSHLPNISRPSLRDILSSDALARLYVLRRYGKEASQ